MQSVNSPIEVTRDRTRQVRRGNDWLETLIEITCWIGILGLIAIVCRDAWSADSGSNRSGLLPGATRNFTQFGQAGGPGGGPGGPPGGFPKGGFDDDDDDDDDDFDDLEDFSPPPSAHRNNPGNNPPPSSGHSSSNTSSNSSPHTFSAGGSPSTGPNPTMTKQGISVGGSQANGVVPGSAVPPVKIDDETAEGSKDIVTDFNFPDADILDIAKTLGKLTGKNFILDKDVKGKITIISNSKITVGDAWKAFLTALDMNGFALVPSGKYIRIARVRDARDKQLKTYTGDFSPDTDALITRVFPLKYISPEEVARTFRSFMPANSRIVPYEQTNTVIVTDTGSNIAKLAKMLEILDVEGFDAGIEVIPVKYASAAELSKLIDSLIPGTSTGGGAPGVPRFGGGGKFNARRTKEGGIINTIMPDERTNTLIVHANSKGADVVRELVAKLDQKLPTSTGGGKVRVVYLQFADAEQVAATLNTFSSQTATTRPTTGTGTGTGVNPNESTLFQGSIKISPDKATNSLVITASPADFVTVKRVIDRLDIPRDQVYVEVVIMEIEINRGFDYSANLVNAPYGGSVTNAADIGSLIQGGPFGSNGALLPFATGGKTDMMINGTKVQVDSVLGLIKVIQSNSNSNILATPQIIALDNSEANFESAEKIPLLSTTAVQATVTQSVTYQSVALSINIKPQISKITNFVKLDVTAKLGNISPRVPPKALQDQAVSTIDRTAKTTVVAGDSDTIVLGGLIRDNVSDTVRKVPLLGDIPILGWLFKSKSSAIQKTNLVIFMTPHIVRQYEKVRAILDKKLKERDEFIETSAGGEDPSRYKRDDIIRSLPDLKDITEKKAKTTFVIDDEEPRKDAEKPAAVQKPADQSWFNPEGRIPGGSSGPSSPASPPGSFSSSSTPTGVQPQSVENILVPTAPLEGNPGTNPAEPSGTPGQ